MKYVKPTVFLIAQSSGMDRHFEDNATELMLRELGASHWHTDDCAEGEELIEIAGRLCYKSFAPELNKNVTKVREGNQQYLANILKQHHGSVLEHASVTFALLNVSRILTHEIVRHRAGTAFSQESGRYVRLDEFQMYKPDAIDELAPGISGQLDALMDDMESQFETIISQVPWDKLDFHQKKRMTSALRRYAPQGQVTNIIVTANHRAWRHMIEMRTSTGAEEEIAKVFYEIAKQLLDAFPNIYQDMGCDEHYQTWKFHHSKV